MTHRNDRGRGAKPCANEDYKVRARLETERQSRQDALRHTLESNPAVLAYRVEKEAAVARQAPMWERITRVLAEADARWGEGPYREARGGRRA